MARLVLTTAEGQKVVQLRQVNSLGRHPSNTIQLLDKIVSKNHCIIERRGQGFVLRDLGSLNGTFVNRERVQGERDLRHGDEIALGQTKAKFEEQQSTGHQASNPQTGLHQPSWQGQPGQGQPGQGQPGQGQPGQGQPGQGQPGQGQPGQGQKRQRAWQGQMPAVPSSHAPSQNGPPTPHTSGVPHSTHNQVHGNPSVPPAAYNRVAPPPPVLRQTNEQGPAPAQRPPPPPRGRLFQTAYLPQVAGDTNVDTSEAAQQIGAEIAAASQDFLPFDDISSNQSQLRADYERLRMSYELTRDIAYEKDLGALLKRILESVFRFIRAQRGVIFVQDGDKLQPVASHRNDGGTGAISVSTTILKKVVDDRKAVLTHDASVDFAASKGKSMILNQIQSAIVAPMLHNDELFGVLWLDSKSLAQFQPKDLELLSSVANQAAMFIEINLLGKQVEDELVTRERLSRLLSPNVAERVIQGQLEVKPGGARTDCTVFNSDIRGFTSMSETTPPEELVEMLNAYFERMVDTVFQYEGTLDKFMGDGIMALWGAPVVHKDDPLRAVECALEQAHVLGTFNRERMSQDRPPLGVGFGIHTGPLVAGYIGSSKALSYTVIGDVANTSARLCSKALAGQILVSEVTRHQLGDRFDVEELAPARMKGKNKPMRIFNILRSRVAVAVPEEITVPPTVAGP